MSSEKSNDCWLSTFRLTSTWRPSNDREWSFLGGARLELEQNDNVIVGKTREIAKR